MFRIRGKIRKYNRYKNGKHKNYFYSTTRYINLINKTDNNSYKRILSQLFEKYNKNNNNIENINIDSNQNATIIKKLENIENSQDKNTIEIKKDIKDNMIKIEDCHDHIIDMHKENINNQENIKINNNQNTKIICNGIKQIRKK